MNSNKEDITMENNFDNTPDNNDMPKDTYSDPNAGQQYTDPNAGQTNTEAGAGQSYTDPNAGQKREKGTGLKRLSPSL